MTPPETESKPVQAAPKSRREMFEKFVAEHPADAFARYGLAMECAKLGDHAAAESHFKQIIGSHPAYVSAYFQFGQLLAKLGRVAEARKILSDGIAQVATTGDEHARGEMQSALDELT